jgi:Holliday junction resolvasome RuvABC DNA-binding subunit
MAALLNLGYSEGEINVVVTEEDKTTLTKTEIKTVIRQLKKKK